MPMRVLLHFYLHFEIEIEIALQVMDFHMGQHYCAFLMGSYFTYAWTTPLTAPSLIGQIQVHVSFLRELISPLGVSG